MTDAGAMGRSGETAVCDKCHAGAEPPSHDVRGRGKHFLHAGTAFRSFITDDDHIALFYFSAEDAFAGFFLTFKDDCRTFVDQHFRIDARRFHDTAVFREIAEQNGESADLAVSIVDRADDGAVRIGRGAVLFRKSFSGDRGRGAVDESGDFCDFFQDRHDPADPLAVLHNVKFRFRRREFADVRGGFGNIVQILDVDFESCFVGDRQRVENGVGGTAHRHVEHQRVAERFRGDEILCMRRIFHFRQLNDAECRFAPEFDAGGIVCGDRAVAGQGDAERFAETVHAVCREHSRTGTRAGAGRAFE